MVSRVTLDLDRRFDRFSCRHFVNGQTSVLHCHHYATLYSQLADDCGMLDGKKLLAECAEDTFYDVLKGYLEKHNICDLGDRIAIIEQYYAATGLGKLRVKYAGTDSGTVVLETSHIDQGWIKKWGKREKPVNFITSGYIAAAFAVMFDQEKRSFKVNEIQSIVSGAEQSVFNVVAR